MSAAEQQWHSIGPFSNPPRGWAKSEERNITWAADLNQSKGYSRPCDVTLSNKRWKQEEEGRGGPLLGKLWSSSRTPAKCVEALIQGRGQSSLIGGK